MREKITGPLLIAHRGYAACFPENTLLALEEALRCGASTLEFDVQLCADGTPVLCHDHTLERTAGIKKDLFDCSYESIKTIQVSEPARFGEQFTNINVPVPTLAQAVDLMMSRPDMSAWIDLKIESLDHYGIEAVVKTVLNKIKPVLSRCVIVSRKEAALQFALSLGIKRIAWVITEWSEASYRKAVVLGPAFLICNHKRLPSEEVDLWPGPWQWCLYEVADSELALALYERGADLIETMDIGKMLEDPRLRKRKSNASPRR